MHICYKYNTIAEVAYINRRMEIDAYIHTILCIYVILIGIYCQHMHSNLSYPELISGPLEGDFSRAKEISAQKKRATSVLISKYAYNCSE